MSLSLNHDMNAYLAVSLSSTSPFFKQPAQIAQVHPAISYVGQVGDLEDVQLFSVPKLEWENISGDVISKLKGVDGVGRVDVQELKARSKRGGDEL